MTFRTRASVDLVLPTIDLTRYERQMVGASQIIILPASQLRLWRKISQDLVRPDLSIVPSAIEAVPVLTAFQKDLIVPKYQSQEKYYNSVFYIKCLFYSIIIIIILYQFFNLIFKTAHAYKCKKQSISLFQSIDYNKDN